MHLRKVNIWNIPTFFPTFEVLRLKYNATIAYVIVNQTVHLELASWGTIKKNLIRSYLYLPNILIVDNSLDRGPIFLLIGSRGANFKPI